MLPVLVALTILFPSQVQSPPRTIRTQPSTKSTKGPMPGAAVVVKPKETPVMTAAEYCEYFRKKRDDSIAMNEAALKLLPKKFEWEKLPQQKKTQLQEPFVNTIKKLKEDRELHFERKDFTAFEKVGDMGILPALPRLVTNKDYRSIKTVDIDLIVLGRRNPEDRKKPFVFAIKGIPVGPYEKNGTVVPLQGVWRRTEADPRANGVPTFELWANEDEARELWKNILREERAAAEKAAAEAKAMKP